LTLEQLAFAHTTAAGSLEPDPEVLRDIGHRFGGRLALNASVVRGGTLRMGHDVVLDYGRL
jgi:hypothetical protein